MRHFASTQPCVGGGGGSPPLELTQSVSWSAECVTLRQLNPEEEEEEEEEEARPP